ncbi:recombinase family protein [Brachybacterium aquaticum]|uniref:DNA invertase Pin-like site-specific DNA recombinase n=1 Tax=Brachybacterium aquaticum TaxID=1432564 RepID=A0A841ACA2_9MICO|nr:recombinase family protein [Brachybacterium aquaticum]MBB5830975.1 DNA invertase Pin-like site-specific DNA recombinase [Brachybacterium aquaticum]
MSPRRTALYARISKVEATKRQTEEDRRDVDAEGNEILLAPLGTDGVDRQLADCRKEAKRRGWTVVDEYVDNNVSASSKRPRPAYERMKADIESGRVDGVVVWDIDRLTRKPSELEEFIKLSDNTGVALASVGGEVDLSTEQGRLTARIKGSVARYEAEQMGRRISRAAKQRATDGASYHGQTPFGYVRAEVEKDGRRVRMLIPDATEAPLVREAYRRLLDGDSLWAIARDFTSRGIVGKRGNPFRGNVLGNLLRRPVYAGLRAYKGEILGDGEWEALVSKEEHARALAILDAPGRFHLHGTAPKYLLSGIARCGREECGGLLRPKVQAGRAPSLVCWDCQKVTRKMAPLDEYVVETVLRRLEGMDLDLVVPEDGTAFAEAVAERDAIQTRMDELADAIARGAISIRIAERSSARLDEELAAAEGRVRSLAPRPDVLDAVGAGAREAWAAADLERRRTLLRMLVDVRVDPSGPGVPFHTDQVRISWLDEKPEDPKPTNS